MAEIRLSKLTKQFNIGLGTLVDFLNEKGAQVEMNPNVKVSDEYLPALEKNPFKNLVRVHGDKVPETSLDGFQFFSFSVKYQK